MYQQRKFNQSAYNSTDRSCKTAAIDLFTSLGFTLKSDLDREYYKDYDILMEKNGMEYKIECEQRFNFIKIKNYFNTIHIPIRKNHCNFDWYLVWNGDCSELFAIKGSDVKNLISAGNIVDIKCEDPNGVYKEEFIDVPKNIATYFFKSESQWKRRR